MPPLSVASSLKIARRRRAPHFTSSNCTPALLSKAGAGVEKLVSPGAAGPQQRLPQGGSSKVAPLVDAENVTDVAKQKARVSMVVEVPEGTEPGTQLLVPGPGGANVAILVPPGARPGTKLTVQY